MKILIIQNDQNILSLLENTFKKNNHIVDKADNGEDGEYLALINKYNIIILDWTLNSKDGISVLNSLREKDISTPILMLTTKKSTENKVLALKAGCDDYITKPFIFEELEARIEALHRRFINNYSKGIVTIKDILIDKNKKTVYKQDKEIFLSAKEIEILLFLIEHKNRFISKYMIEDMLYNQEQIVSSNVISVTIYNLRKKLRTNIIKNYRGLGYKIET